jgi:hypothetical protein
LVRSCGALRAGMKAPVPLTGEVVPVTGEKTRFRSATLTYQTNCDSPTQNHAPYTALRKSCSCLFIASHRFRVFVYHSLVDATVFLPRHFGVESTIVIVITATVTPP